MERSFTTLCYLHHRIFHNYYIRQGWLCGVLGILVIFKSFIFKVNTWANPPLQHIIWKTAKRQPYFYKTSPMNIPLLSHFCGSIFPWAHLLNRGSLKPECLLMTWLRNPLNFAKVTLPLPLKVEVALQWRCLSHGFIHSDKASQSFSFAIFDSTLQISVERQREKQNFHKGLDWSGNVSVSIQASRTGLG